jgi:ATP-dependent exoDNAse (exonuclease V) beta subunit
VQAPAGSGKTDLLTRRYLRLLADVDDPSQIVAITFTRAAAAEMRHRILAELERAGEAPDSDGDPSSMQSLAQRALARSRARGWQLPELPAQLRISTIDSFCRDLAIQQPLLSGFGADLSIADQADDLYRRAARITLESISEERSALTDAIEALVLWRDNGWHEMEELLIAMLRQRDRWMHDFVLEREPDWIALRARLERPFAHAIEDALHTLDCLLDQLPLARAEALSLARFACAQLEGALYQDLAELAEWPAGPFDSFESLDTACRAYECFADLLLTKDGDFRKKVDKNTGFPPSHKREKERHAALVAALRTIDGFESALAAVHDLPAARYTEDEWRIVRACFTLLRRAAAELRTVFAESGTVDFTEVAQIAQRVLLDEDGSPSDAALDVAGQIHHLLIDEFQDTSRRQHRLLASIAAAWPDTVGRSIFVVGDPMQSIYFFREADAELFDRVRAFGLETPGSALPFDFVPLAANFRTQPQLVARLNAAFAAIFAQPDGSGVQFSAANPARPPREDAEPALQLHLRFSAQGASPDEAEQTAAEQTAELVALMRAHLARAADAQARGEKYRVAVLARARKSLTPIAAALREDSIPFLAVELETLKDRPEVLDALSLARALLNPHDRVAWLGVLRAPWCGLALAHLHTLTSADDANLIAQPIPELLAARIDLVAQESRAALERVLRAASSDAQISAAIPTAALGTWLEQAWLSLGGASCVDATARANLDLLWSCLDKLPNGAQDLLSPALDAALGKLTAQPDADASADWGIQLMTIHKSKGLEFEVVIVPDLEARGGRSRPGLLSWFERGLAEPDESGDLTEFLVAPLPTKGGNRGRAKAWVDREYGERESQETRRILYVAATRAREELHLFARPAYKQDEAAYALVKPSSGLLATAWPAFEDEMRAQFDERQAAAALTHYETDEEVVPALAAQSEIVAMPAPIVLHRLPAHFDSPPPLASRTIPADHAALGPDALFSRHEGGLLTRVLGTATHSLLEELAHLRATLDWPAARAALAAQTPRIAARIRAAGMSLALAQSIAGQALDLALAASHDPQGQWLLEPRQDAVSEAAWSGEVSGTIRTVRVDRVFRAGSAPLAAGSDVWWIIDYKTAHADNLEPGAALPGLRRIFAPQLEAYAAILQQLHGADTPVCAALYYPRIARLDWWEIR